MARTKRIFREWQHPRASNGRFAKKGSPEWVRAAADKFRKADDGLKAGTTAPGMPGGQRRGISRGAKAERALAAHDATVTTGLGRQPVQGPAAPKVKPGPGGLKEPTAEARAADMAARERAGLGIAEAQGITGRQAWGALLSGPQKERVADWRSKSSAPERAADRRKVEDRTAAVLGGGAPKRANVFDNPEFAGSTGRTPAETEREKARQERLMSGAGSAMVAQAKTATPVKTRTPEQIQARYEAAADRVASLSGDRLESRESEAAHRELEAARADYKAARAAGLIKAPAKVFGRKVDTSRDTGNAGGVKPTTTGASLDITTSESDIEQRYAKAAAAISARKAAERAAAAPALSDEQRGNYDKLLGNGPGEGFVQHKQSRQIVEQLEQHGWTLSGNAPEVSLMSFKAPDGREIGVQFLVGQHNAKPRFFTGHASRGRDVSYKAALAHVVTPTHEGVGGPNVTEAAKRAGVDLPALHEIGGRNDPTFRPLQEAQKGMHSVGSYGGRGESADKAATDLRAAAVQNRKVADHRVEFNQKNGLGDLPDDNVRLLRQRADQFEQVATELRKMDAERQAYLAEKDRRAGLPLDIRPTPRTGPAKPAKKAAPKPAMQQVSDTIAEQRGLPKLSDAQVRNGIAMRGNRSPEGKALQAEADRRGLASGPSGLAKIAADMKALHDEVFAGQTGHKKGDKVLSSHAVPPGAAPREYTVTQDVGPGELVPVHRVDFAGRDVHVKIEPGSVTKAAAAERAPNAVGDASLGADATPAQIDVIKDISGSAKASLDAGTNPATAYHNMDRGTLLALARQAKIPVRGKSNDDIAAALSAKDAENKAARAARKAAALNPASTGDRSSSQHDVHTPARSPVRGLLNPDSLPADRGTRKGGFTPWDREGQGGRIMTSGYSRVGSQADRYDRHKNLTREQFDALSETRQRTVLDELRQVVASREQVSSTIASNRSGFHGATLRGTKDAPHVEGARNKLRELTYTAPPPIDNSIAGRAARLKTGDRYAAEGTIEELNQIAREAGFAGFPASWKRQKGVDYLRNQAIAGDRRKAASLSTALDGATPAEAMAVMEIRDADGDLTIGDIGTAAKVLGVGSLTGTKQRRMQALADAVGKRGAARPKAEAAPVAAPDANAKRAANLDKARTAQRDMRAEELARTTDPKDNGAKIRALEDGTIGSADLYKTASAGPSGQRAQVLVGRVRHTPDNKAGEFKITGKDGSTAGWASRTVRNGEPVYSVHSEGPDGEQRLEGWTGELATAADVLNNGHFAARGYGADARRVSSGTFEPYKGRDKTVAELDREALDREIRQHREALANPGITPGIRARHEASLAKLEAEKRGESPAAGAGAGAAPTGRAARIEATLKALPDGFKPDEQTRQQYVVESKGTWHVGMEGHPYYLQDMKSKRDALAWIVNAQASRERLRNDPINRADSTPYGKYGSLSRADFDKLPPARQREIAAELGAVRRNPTGDGGASLLIGKLGLAPTPAQRQAGDVTAHPSAIRAAAGQPASGRITPAAKRGVLDTPRDKSHSGGAGKTPTTEANMSNPTPRQMPYTTGRRVEVQVQNFDKPGFPMEWMPGTVDEHRLDDNGRIDMRVKLDKGGFAGRQIIGKQGGNKNVRPIAPKSTVDPDAEARRMQADTDRAAAERQRVDAEETARRNTPQATTAPVRTFEAKTDEQVIAEGQARRADVRAKVDAATTEREARDAIHGLSKAQLLRLNNDMGGQGVQGSSEDTLRRSVVAMAVKPSAPAKKAAPGEPQLGVTESSKGRTTTVTLPDGTTATRTSKTMAYTHAVITTTDHRGDARDLRADADQNDKFADALQAWVDAGSDFSKLEKHRSASLSGSDKQEGRSPFEYFLPGFGPVRHTAKRSRYGGGGDYLHDDHSYGLPDPADRKPLGYAYHEGEHDGQTRLDRYGPQYMIANHRKMAAGARAHADKLDAGPAETYGVFRWSQSYNGAASGANEIEKVRNYRTQIIGVGGVAKAPTTPAKVLPTAEEKAAAAEVKKAAEATRNADSRKEFLDRVIGGIEKDIAEGKDPAAALHYTDAGLRQLAKDVGAKIPRQPRSEYGTTRPLDKEQARRLIVEAVRERLGKA